MDKEFKNIKFRANMPYIVKLKYDKPIEKEGEYGAFWVYGVEHNGEEYSFIASMGLHNQLLQYKKGDTVEIMKSDDGEKSHFETELLEEKDIKSTADPTNPQANSPDWDRINADKQHSITLQVAVKLAVQSFPVKPKLTDKDYEEIEVRAVKFKAIIDKYLGIVQIKPEQKAKFSPLVQAKWDEFDKFLNENKDKMDADVYKLTHEWLDNLKDPTTKKLTENLAKLKERLKSDSKYSSYHESLITACCETLKTKDRLPVIQTLNNMVKKWGIDGTEELSDTSENQCLNLLEEFDKQQVAEQDDNLPY